MKKILTISFLILSEFVMSQTITLNTMADTITYYKSTARPLEVLNSDEVDYAPSISADGKTMIIESNKSGKYELYESKFLNGNWTSPEPLDEINDFGEDSDLIGGPSLSFDGNKLFFFASFRSGFGSEDIYYSEREGEKWSEPKNIGAPINSSNYEGFPSISADGGTLYFVRQNFNGPSDKELAKIWINTACYSIYKSEFNRETNVWDTPELLPFPINQDCEKAPRIMADNRTLIFASNRLGGYGDYDLYQTQLNTIGDWESPNPLEFINTDKADLFASISAQGDILYYVYDVKDIYSVEIPPHLRQFKNNIIQGFITNGDDGTGLAAEIIVSDAFTSKEIIRTGNNSSDGRYTVVLPVGNNYNIEIKKAGFTSQSFFYDLSNVDEYREIDQNISLFPSAHLNLNIYDIDIFEPISANIQIKIEGERGLYKDIENDPNGKITLDLPLGNSYEIIISKKNFNSEYFIFDVSDLVVYRDFERDVEMSPIKRDVAINISDITNDGKIRSRVRIRNQNRDEVIIVEGNETVALRVGDRYEIEATSDQGYAFNSTVIEVTEDGEKVVGGAGADDQASGGLGGGGLLSRGIQLKLQPLIVGADLTLKEILFESNSDNLNEISYIELARVITLMNENPNLQVEIDAHSDDVGPADYNQLLSERRAQSVVRFLIENKIDQNRFTAKGLGESEPVVPNDTPENRAKNRRVVLRILAI